MEISRKFRLTYNLTGFTGSTGYDFISKSCRSGKSCLIKLDYYPFTACRKASMDGGAPVNAFLRLMNTIGTAFTP